MESLVLVKYEIRTSSWDYFTFRSHFLPFRILEWLRVTPDLPLYASDTSRMNSIDFEDFHKQII
jgi:hypothetical protein